VLLRRTSVNIWHYQQICHICTITDVATSAAAALNAGVAGQGLGSSGADHAWGA